MTGPSVAILHFTSPPVVGGVEMLLGVHAALLKEHGFTTRVISGKGGPFRSDVPVQVISELYSKDPELVAINEELDQGIVSERFHDAVDRIYQALLPALAGLDVAIVHNTFTLHFNLPLTAALHRMIERQEGPRFVSWCHDLSWTNALYLPKMREEFPWSLLKRPLDSVDYVVVSELRRGELASLFDWAPERLKVIPAGVDPVSQLKLEPETARLVERLDLLGGELVMLAPARITKRKNLEMSIRILRALIDLDVQARLLVTGPPGPHNVRAGDYVSNLRTLRRELGVEREAILLFEHVGPDMTPEPANGGTSAAHEGGRGGDSYPVTELMMYDFYSLADLLLFSSSQEGFGIPLLEAGLLRLPVFCSDIPPFREIGADAVHYFELEDSPTTVAARIHSWMRDDNVYRLRRRAISHYSWNAIFEERIRPLVAGK